ncbi:uncharacterized protein LOC131149049 [Malania oleifera]|uniref:uncharacterized protein LOC131149049 n=1 Tax=Malania oleifera TaxID=397392 RepID=UPI0025AE49CC|nr:uncharacterized protein LOC131149049 [Malania oleifera]
MFNGLNFVDWSEQVQFHLGVLDLDLTLLSDQPGDITDSSSAEEITYYSNWERSNRFSLMFMRMSVTNNIKTTIPKTENAKEFLKFVGEHSQIVDKSLAGTLMGTLTTMKFDDSRTIHEHVVEMTNIAAKLRTLGIDVNENFLIQFILNSLPTEYGPFQMNYNTVKDKWNVHELHSMLVQEETQLNNKEIHSIHYVNNQGAEKKAKKHGKGKGSLKDNESFSHIQKKVSSKDKCCFYGKPRHYQKYCFNWKAWFERKGKPRTYVCFELNLAEVPYNTWWIDFGRTTHVSNMM